MSIFSKSSSFLDVDAFIRCSYRGILGREADFEGLKVYSEKIRSGSLKPEELLREFVRSDEFKARSSNNAPSDYSSYGSEDVKSFALEVKNSKRYACSDLDAVCGGLKGLEYYELHKERFTEMINFIGFLSERRGDLKILECGSIFSTYFIKALLSGSKVSTIDIKDADDIGYRGVFLLREIVEHHYKLDLLEQDLTSLTLNEEGQFDLVLLCEVIEHLLIHPIKIFRFLLRQLKPGGYLYITTPNLFKKNNVMSFDNRVSPLPIYPEHYSRSDAHMFHIREYAMGELLEIATRAGGVIAGFYFSSCWDALEDINVIPDDQLSNLVLIVKKPSEEPAFSR